MPPSPEAVARQRDALRAAVLCLALSLTDPLAAAQRAAALAADDDDLADAVLHTCAADRLYLRFHADLAAAVARAPGRAGFTAALARVAHQRADRPRRHTAALLADLVRRGALDAGLVPDRPHFARRLG